jgi:hypothetical protein
MLRRRTHASLVSSVDMVCDGDVVVGGGVETHIQVVMVVVFALVMLVAVSRDVCGNVLIVL